MTDSYLKILAKAQSVKQFQLELALQTGEDPFRTLADYELDYCKRISEFKLYAQEFIKDGKVSFEDCINSKYPILKSFGIETVEAGKMYVVRFFDHNGMDGQISYNYDLAEDMHSIHGIDTECQMYYMFSYELEKSK